MRHNVRSELWGLAELLNLINTELWGLAELLNLINTEIKARVNCGEYNFCQGNKFDHLDLRSTSALASQARKSVCNKCDFHLGQLSRVNVA